MPSGLKILRWGLIVTGGLLLAAGLVLVSGIFSSALVRVMENLTRAPAMATWPYRLRQIGGGLSAAGILALAGGLWAIPSRAAIRDWIITAIHNRPRWREILVGSLFDIEMSPRLPQPAWPAWRGADWLILAGFLVYALLLWVGCLQGDYPYLPLSGDSGNTASYAAGFDHPDWFRGDILLGQTRNIQLYSTFNVFFTRLTYPLTGSYSLSLNLLVLPVLFFNLLGFYLLGRVLFARRGWAVLLVLLLMMPFQLKLGESWGFIPDAVARFNFQAALPFVLCMVLVWRDRPARWPWIMAATGALVYLHPVSTPVWAVAIWLSLWLCAPGRWSFVRRLLIMGGLGLIFVAVALPYLANYLGNHVQGQSASYEMVYQVITEYMPANLINIPAAMAEFYDMVDTAGLVNLALVGLLAVILLVNRTERVLFKIFAAWVGGIVLMSVLLPWGVHTLERQLRLIPMETELVRGIRYLVMFMLIFAVWGVFELSRRARLRAGRTAFGAAGVLLAVCWGVMNPPPLALLGNAVNCLLKGQVVCTAPSDYEQVVRAVRELTPPGAPIMTTFGNNPAYSYGIAIRFNGLRPLVYSFKDRGQLVYSNQAALQQWYDANQAEMLIQDYSQRPSVKLKRYLPLARQLGAGYIVTELKYDPAAEGLEGLRVIYSNSQFYLLQIQ